jgi:hypothetical protein
MGNNIAEGQADVPNRPRSSAKWLTSSDLTPPVISTTEEWRVTLETFLTPQPLPIVQKCAGALFSEHHASHFYSCAVINEKTLKIFKRYCTGLADSAIQQGFRQVEYQWEALKCVG